MIYLDNASTSWPKPQRVMAAMEQFMREEAANPGRAGYRRAVAAERRIDDVRRKLANLFDAPNPSRVIMCSNCTDALNMAIKGSLRESDHVVTTVLEHNSVSRPLRAMEEAGSITVTRIPIGADGRVDPEAVRNALQKNTRLVVITHASNVTGVIQPVEEIGRIIREHQAWFLVDAAQGAGEIPISVRQWGIDLLAFPGHKGLLGPMGTGGLYVADGVELRPWREGGTGGDSSSPTQPREFPYFLEGGTPNVVGIAGLGAALDGLNPQEVITHVRGLLAHLVQRIGDLAHIHLVSNPDPHCRVGTISILMDGMTPEEAGAILDESFDVAVRPGLHCAPGTHRALNTFPDGTIRVSPGSFTTTAEIDAFCEALSQISEPRS